MFRNAIQISSDKLIAKQINLGVILDDIKKDKNKSDLKIAEVYIKLKFKNNLTKRIKLRPLNREISKLTYLYQFKTVF